MINNLRLENFRGFQSFELQNLARLNLLVGKNNSGKSSVLEAIHMLYSPNDPRPIINTLQTRGEYIRNENGKKEIDIRHLFYGHEIIIDNKISVVATNTEIERRFEALVKISNNLRKEVYGDKNYEEKISDDYSSLSLTLNWIYEKNESTWNIPLSNNEGLVSEEVSRGIRMSKDSIRSRAKINKEDSEGKVQFINSFSLTPEETIELFDRIVLTPEEGIVTEALKKIEPQIERIAAITSGYNRSNSREGFLILLSDHQRIPIGSMGDGIWRMLGLSLAIVGAKNGVMLVDEIDTGLHYSTMYDMWKLIWETAKRLNVQVFATTHSDDCWRSLADLADRENLGEGDISIQRIERTKNVAVDFSRKEVIIAANRDIEVR